MKKIHRRSALLAVGVLVALPACSNGASTEVVQAGQSAEPAPTTVPGRSAESVASEIAPAPAGTAVAFRSAVLALDDGTARYPFAASVESLVEQSDAVVVGTVGDARLEATPSGASGPLSSADAAEWWWVADVTVTEVVAGDAVKVGDTVQWAWVAWMGDPQMAEDARKELDQVLVAATPSGAEATLFLHHSRVVPGWWSHSNGAGALIADSGGAAALHPELSPGSAGIFDRPDEVLAAAAAASQLVGQRTDGASLPE